jgi:hypothetical protein
MKKHHKITAPERDQVAWRLACRVTIREMARRLGRSLCKVFGLTLEFRGFVVSKRALFETHLSFLLFPEQEGYGVVSKLVSKSKFQNLTIAMSFDTLLIYANLVMFY